MNEMRIVQERMRAAALQALKTAAEDLMGRAQRDAPLDEGTLRGSARVEIAETPLGMEAQVSFNTPYAARQHEETTWKHPKGGKAKYLEANLLELAPRYERIIGLAVEKAIG